MVQITADASSTAGRPQRRRLEILAAASRAFRRRGLHATGMRDIAAETGMHVGNLYYYFRNKQELLAFCQQQTLAGLLGLAQHILDSSAPADLKLERLIRGHVVCLNEQLPGSLAHLEVEALEEPWREAIMRQRDRYEAAVRAIIEQGIDEGLLRPVDSGVAARAILGSVNWTVKWFRPDGSKTSEEIGTEVADLLVRGLSLGEVGEPPDGRATGKTGASEAPQPVDGGLR